MEEKSKSITEEILVAGQDLLETIKKLIAQGKLRSIRIKSEDGKLLLEIPMNTGLLVGGAMVVLAPFFAIIAGIVALYKKVKVEVIRTDDSDV